MLKSSMEVLWSQPVTRTILRNSGDELAEQSLYSLTNFGKNVSPVEKWINGSALKMNYLVPIEVERWS